MPGQGQQRAFSWCCICHLTGDLVHVCTADGMQVNSMQYYNIIASCWKGIHAANIQINAHYIHCMLLNQCHSIHKNMHGSLQECLYGSDDYKPSAMHTWDYLECDSGWLIQQRKHPSICHNSINSVLLLLTTFTLLRLAYTLNMDVEKTAILICKNVFCLSRQAWAYVQGYWR